MRLKFDQTMATAIESLVIDSQSRFLEMKSLQPYSTKDEYLYAMKEDLAEWLANMYPDWCPITAENFIECLENGALLCHHANNVNEAARKASAAILLTNCKYRSDARSQTFNARDNVSQFIQWCRHVASVREVLMFESDDLILRKNEKNFILCLLEIARFGAKFGLSVPAIIKLEQEIEREIERDQQGEEIPLTELEQFQSEEEEEEENQTEQIELDLINQDDQQIHSISSSDANGANVFEQSISQIANDNSNQVENSDQPISNEMTTTVVPSNNDLEVQQNLEEEHTSIVPSNNTPEFQQNLEGEGHKPVIPPASSSQLHKTVVQIVNSCCCSQRFPVVRIGEGKYRIGKNGTIIFIRILRNHVMVRVGGGWDTLENYLNKHDPCRRSGGHHHHHHHHPHSDIPILAIPNTNISPSVQKNTPFGKSVTIKTDEFPLPKPSNHDTNLVDAQLVITRGADGRHRIGQITYKSEEDILNQPPACPHHHHSPPSAKSKPVRNTGRFTPTSIYNKQSSPSTDQDYSSLTETTIPSKPSSTSSLDSKEDSIEEAINSLGITTTTEDRPIRRYSPIQKSQTEPLTPINTPFIEPTKPINPPVIETKSSITESIIGNIDGYIRPRSFDAEQDFDINDIEEVMGLNQKTHSADNTLNMDNDSLESSEGIVEEKKKSAPPVSFPSPTKKSSAYTSPYNLAQKKKLEQEQAANRKRPVNNLQRFSSRSNTNVAEATKKEGQVLKPPRRQPTAVRQRSQSSEIVQKLQDISKLDRDSGFDEQDFRRESFHSNDDDNSSVTSAKSIRSSIAPSITSDYRENKSYELRIKKLESKRASMGNSPLPTRRTVTTPSTPRRSSATIPPIPPSNRARKNSQPTVHVKPQAKNSP